MRAYPVSPEIRVIVNLEPKTYSNDVEFILDAEWRMACESNPSLFNGDVLIYGRHETDAAGRITLIEGCFIDYRTLYGSRKRPDVFKDQLPIPLGVSGVTVCQDGLVFGRRGPNSAFGAGQWELIPSGTIDRSCIANEILNYATLVMHECEEEIGLHSQHLAKPVLPFVFLIGRDQGAPQADLGLLLEFSQSRSDIEALFKSLAVREHSEIDVIGMDKLAAAAHTLSPMLTTSQALAATYQQYTKTRIK
ncbi:MAG: hypothetical protein EXR11_04755 [Rhodospirillaceae bacterium]|nr:hypothetical protein [Rhodospirillaceae bacterium]